MWQKILVALDMSESAQKALKTAIQLAKVNGACMTIIVVAQLPEYAATVGEVTEAKSEAQKWFGPLLIQAQTEANEQGVQAIGELHFGHPADVIVDYLKKHPQDAVILGHKGTSGIQKFLLGGVSTKVVHHAPCSVLIVK